MQKRQQQRNAEKMIDKIFFNERNIRLAVQEMRQDKCHVKTGGNGSGALISDPTAAKGIADATPLPAVTLDNGETIREPEKWLQLINHCYDTAGDAESDIVEKLYRKNLSTVAIAMKCGFSRSSVYYIINEFKEYALQVACQLGLLEVVRIKNM